MQGERPSPTLDIADPRRRRYSRRQVIGGAAGLTALAALLQACGGAPVPAPPTSAPAAPAPTQAAQPAAATKPAAVPTTKAAAGQPTAKAAGAAPVEVRFATDWVSGVRGETVKIAVPEFEKRFPEIKVKVEPIGGGYWDAVNVQFAGGTVADVLLSDGYFFQVYKDQNGFVPLDDFLKQRGVNMASYSVVPNVSNADGKQYGIPAQLAVSGWYYNVDLFKEAGVKLPTESWTWDDVVAAAQQLTKPDKKQYGLLLPNSDEFGWGPLLFSKGAAWRSDNDTTCLLATEGGIEAFQWYIDLIFKHKLSPAPADAKALQGEFADPFSAGRIAMQPTGIHGVGFILQRVGNRFEFDIMPTPQAPKTGKTVQVWNDQPHFVTSGAAKRRVVEQAAELALFMGGEFVQGQIAVFRGSIPTLKQLQTGEAYLKPPPKNMIQVSKNLSMPDMRPAPYIHKVGHEFKEAYRKQIEKAFTGEVPAADALRAAAADADKVLARATKR